MAVTRRAFSPTTLEAVIGAVYLQERHRRRAHGRAQAVRPAARRGAPARRRPGLEDQPAGALRLGRARCARLPRRGAGSDHRKEFTATVIVAGRSYGNGDGRTKKEAEQKAAEAAWRELSDQVAPTAVPTASRSEATPAMPELPEVEVVRRGLASHVAGRRDRPGRGAAPARGPQASAGCRRTSRPAGRSHMVAARRRGKYLWVELAHRTTRCSPTSA